MSQRPDWFYRRDPWYWATWEGARLAALLAAREVSFGERIRRVAELAERGRVLSAVHHRHGTAAPHGAGLRERDS